MPIETLRDYWMREFRDPVKPDEILTHNLRPSTIDQVLTEQDYPLDRAFVSVTDSNGINYAVAHTAAIEIRSRVLRRIIGHSLPVTHVGDLSAAYDEDGLDNMIERVKDATHGTESVMGEFEMELCGAVIMRADQVITKHTVAKWAKEYAYDPSNVKIRGTLGPIWERELRLRPGYESFNFNYKKGKTVQMI